MPSPPPAYSSPSKKTLVIVFLVSLVSLVLGLGLYAALKKKKKSAREISLNQFFNAPLVNRYRLIADTGTWSLNVTNNALQLQWTSDTSYTVWDSFHGTCGPNSISYSILSNSVWFDSVNYVPYGLGFPNSFSILATTPAFTDSVNFTNYTFNLVLYQGMLRIEQNGVLNPGIWNNYEGISANGGNMPTSPIWPSSQGDSTQVLWQIGSQVHAAQFRGNGEFLVGNGVNPYNPANGIGSWFAHTYSSLSNLCQS